MFKNRAPYATMGICRAMTRAFLINAAGTAGTFSIIYIAGRMVGGNFHVEKDDD